nr:hypothetical protein [Tanacetum cinerariifolium]
ASIRKYTNSVTKTKAIDYGYIKWIEDLVPRTMLSQEQKLLSILNGFNNKSNLQLLIVLGTRLCQLLTKAFYRG